MASTFRKQIRPVAESSALTSHAVLDSSVRLYIPHRRVVLVIIAAIAAAGFFLRILNLAAPSFSVDEILHIFTAQRISQGQAAELPSGTPYTRALLFTQLVAFCGRFGGINEWTARLPSVIFGSLTIVLVFVMARRWYSDGAALVAASFTAIAPMQIAFSREARMYAMFQFLYLAFVLLFFQAVESPSNQTGRGWLSGRTARWRRSLEICPILLLVSGALFLLALHTHRLMLIAVVGPLGYVFGMAVLAVCAGRRLQLPKRKYMAAAVAMLVLGAGLVASSPNQINDLPSATRYVPEWAANNVRWSYYYHWLSDSYGLVVHTFLIAAVAALTLNSRATIYLATCLGVPLLIQSLLFSWKHERYIFHLLPLMFIVFSAGFCTALTHLYRSISGWARQALSGRAAAITAALLIVLAVFFPASRMPGLTDGLGVHQRTDGSFAGVTHHDWRSAVGFVSAHAGCSDAVVASAPSLAKYYGLARPLYFMANDSTDVHLESNLRDQQGHPLDYIAGTPMILNLPALQQLTAEYPSGWIVAERFRFYGSRRLPEDIVQFVENTCRREDLADAPAMIVWRWGETRSPAGCAKMSSPQPLAAEHTAQ